MLDHQFKLACWLIPAIITLLFAQRRRLPARSHPCAPMGGARTPRTPPARPVYDGSLLSPAHRGDLRHTDAMHRSMPLARRPSPPLPPPAATRTPHHAGRLAVRAGVRVRAIEHHAAPAEIAPSGEAA